MRRKDEKRMRRLFAQYRPSGVDQERKKEALRRAQLLLREQNLVPEKSRAVRIAEQVSYISPLAWIVQGGVLLFLFWAGVYNPSGWGVYAAALAVPLLGAIAFTEILRGYYRNMWELEEACLYNLRQLAGIKLLIFGALDLTALAALWLVFWYERTAPFVLLLLLIVPFQASNALYLAVLHVNRRCPGYLLFALAAGVDIGVCYVGQMIYESLAITGLFKAELTGAAVPAAVVTFLLLAGMMALFLRDMGKEKRWSLE